MKERLLMPLTCIVLSIGSAWAQNQSVSGIVISEESGEPIIGASVLVKGTTQGTVTDMDGKFTISNLPNSAKVLQVLCRNGGARGFHQEWNHKNCPEIRHRVAG